MMGKDTAHEDAGSIPSPAKDVRSQELALQHCLKLLQGDSDEHKFAGLVMVTKHVHLRGDSADATTAVTLRRIFNSVGVSFLHRLLRTEETREGRDGLSLYQQVALGVLGAFCVDKTLAPDLVPFAPALVRALRRASVQEMDSLLDAVTCVQALSALPEGMSRLLRAGVAAAVSSYLVNRSSCRVKGVARQQESIGIDSGEQGRVGQEKTNRVEGIGKEGGIGHQAEQLGFIFLNSAIVATEGQCLGTLELLALAETFRDDPSSRKFDFMEILLRWFSYQDTSTTSATSYGRRSNKIIQSGASNLPLKDEELAWLKHGAFPSAVREGLVQAFHGAAGDNHRDLAMTLFAVMLRVLGQEWAVEEEIVKERKWAAGEGKGPGMAATKFETGVGRKRGTFVSFAMRGAGGEVRILLDESLSLLLPSEGEAEELVEKAQGPMNPMNGGGSEQEGGEEAKEEERHDVDEDLPRPPQSAEEKHSVKERRVARLLRMVPVALGAVESAIVFLCGSGDDEDGEVKENSDLSGQWDTLPVQALQDLQQTLSGLFGSVLEFLSEIRPWILNCRPMGTPEIFGADIWALQRLGLHCARAIGAWAAEDPDSLRSEFLAALPVLLALRAREEPPDSDDESDDEEGGNYHVSMNGSCTAAGDFVGCGGWGPAFGGAEDALPCLLRALLALSYDDTPLAAIVEEGVTERLVRMVETGPARLQALFSIQGRAGAEEGSEALRGPLMCACSLLTNILTRASQIAWPGSDTECMVPQHPQVGECMASLAEVATLAGVARQAGGGVRWRLLIAHSACVVLVAARVSPGPAPGLSSKIIEDSNSGEERSVWEGLAQAVDDSLGTMSAIPGEGLIGGKREEEASYEEGSIWQWCLECAREIEVEGATNNLYVVEGIIPRRMLQSLVEASNDGRI